MCALFDKKFNAIWSFHPKTVDRIYELYKYIDLYVLFVALPFGDQKKKWEDLSLAQEHRVHIENVLERARCFIDLNLLTIGPFLKEFC